MINPTIMQLKIELSNSKHDFAEQELKIKRLFWELQSLSNPFYTSISEIKAEELVQCTHDMLQTKNKLTSIEKKIKSIEEQLGEK